MSLLTIVSELWRFLRDNLLRIFLGAIIIAVIVAGGRYFLGQILFGSLQSSTQYLQEVFQQEPASFKVIVTIEDGQILSNPHIYDDYFTTPEVVAGIEEETGINFSQILAAEKELELYKTPSYRGSIAGVRDNASGVFTFRFLVGETAEENLAIAQAYQNLLMSEEVPMASKHEVDVIEDASMGEKFDIEVYDIVATPEVLNVYLSTSVRPIIIYGILGFIIGFMLSFALFFFLRLTKSRIQYAFEYSWDIDDEHLMLNANTSSLAELVNKLSENDATIYVQTPETSHKAMDDLEILSSVQEVNEKPSFIIIKSNQTDKKWYKQTYQIARLKHQPITIIHLI